MNATLSGHAIEMKLTRAIARFLRELVRPGRDWLTRMLADHTYVTSSDGRVWPCFGRSSGGNVICSGFGDADLADCLARHEPNRLSSTGAGIIYGVTGVCHQTADRILDPAGVMVSEARAYRISHFYYGYQGTRSPEGLADWKRRQQACRRPPPAAPTSGPASGGGGGGPGGPSPGSGTGAGAGSRPRDAEYLLRLAELRTDPPEGGNPEGLGGAVRALYSDGEIPRWSEIDDAEVELFADTYLGWRAPRAQLLEAARGFHEVRWGLFGDLLRGRLRSGFDLAMELNGEADRGLRLLAGVMGKDDYRELFRRRPVDTGTGLLVDPCLADRLYTPERLDRLRRGGSPEAGPAF